MNNKTVKRIEKDNLLKKRDFRDSNRNGRKFQLGPGKQTAKTWFGLEN
jgi:hypothetical protein